MDKVVVVDNGHAIFSQGILVKHGNIYSTFFDQFALRKDIIILGHPFFYVFNPTVDWQQGNLVGEEVSFQTPRYKYHYKVIAKIQEEAFGEIRF